MGGGQGLCLGPTGLAKALGAVGNWGLGSRNRRGTGVPPHTWSQRVGDLTWEPSRLPGLEWVRQTVSSPLLLLLSWRALPVLEGPSRLPLLFSPRPSSYAPRTHVAWRGLWRAGDWPGSSAGSWARVVRANALRSFVAPPGGPLLPTSPDLPGLRGASPVWPPLLLPHLSPHVLLVYLGVPPISLGVRVSHQWPAATLVVGRR